MTKFHSDEYVRFLRSIRPDNIAEYNKQMQRCTFFTNFLPLTPKTIYLYFLAHMCLTINLKSTQKDQ